MDDHHRLIRFDELRRLERRAAVSLVASTIGHLIGTPLHVISGRAALIRTNPGSPETPANAARIEEQVERLALRIRRLIDYLTAANPPSTAEPLAELSEHVLALYAPVAEEAGVVLTASLSDATVSVDGTTALVVLTGLLSLALRTAQRSDCVHLHSSTLANVAVVELSIPRLVPPKGSIDLLDPPEGDLGDAEAQQVLSVCAAIVRAQGGGLEVTAGERGGALVRVRFPWLP